MKIKLDYIKTIELKPLAFALLVKDTYVSSAVKDYNPYSLQQKLKERGFNFHHTTIKKYVSVLLRHNLAVMQDGNLIIRKLYDRINAYLYIKKNESKTFKEYVHFIRLAILKRKVKQAKFVYNRKLFIIKKLDNPDSPKQYRRAKYLSRKTDISDVNGAEFEYKQSIKSFANLFGCSIGDVYTTIKFLVSRGYLMVKKEIKKIVPYLGGEFSEGYFVWRGWLYRAECNSYSIPL